jgi:hypothetical protein
MKKSTSQGSESQPTPEPDPADRPANTASDNGQPDEAPNPFDPVSLRLPQDYTTGQNTQKPLLSVPVRKPANSWWVRVHPSADYHLQTSILELKEEGEIYLIAPVLRLDLEGEATVSPRALYTAMNRQGVLFIWPVRLPQPDGRADEWSRTSLEAVELAMKGWVRITANQSLGAYDVHMAGGRLGEPVWPQVPFAMILKVAFQNRYIDSLEHPVLRRLRGEV